MPLPATREQIIRHYIDAYNRFDVEGMLRHLHPSIVFENLSGGQVTLALHGIEAFRAQAEKAKEVFSSREQIILHLSFNGDVVDAAIRYKGVLATDLPRGLKKGDTIELEGRSIFLFGGEQIIRLTDIS